MAVTSATVGHPVSPNLKTPIMTRVLMTVLLAETETNLGTTRFNMAAPAKTNILWGDLGCLALDRTDGQIEAIRIHTENFSPGM
ncbi:hypothetical protein [Corynebacterium lactis]|nr:hypothetical protein [Corynebacterium lactis]